MVLWLSPVHRHNYYPTHQQTIRHKYIVQLRQICTKSAKKYHTTQHIKHTTIDNVQGTRVVLCWLYFALRQALLVGYIESFARRSRSGLRLGGIGGSFDLIIIFIIIITTTNIIIIIIAGIIITRITTMIDNKSFPV